MTVSPCDGRSLLLCWVGVAAGSVRGKITSNLSPVASGPETSRDGWVWKGGGRRGHPGWQQNLSCLGASHLLPSAHWFCAGRDQISQLIKEEKVKWRNGQRQTAKYRRSVLETQLQSRMLEPVRLVDKYTFKLTKMALNELNTSSNIRFLLLW